MGMAEATEEAGIFFLVAIGVAVSLGVFLLWVICGLIYVFLKKENRKDRARYFWRFTIKAIIYGGAFIGVALSLFLYMNASRARLEATANACRAETSPDGKYTLNTCYAHKKVVLRLYARPGSTLLAERTCSNDVNVSPEVFWEPDEVGYLGCSDFVTMKLPPSLLDKLLSTLP